MKKIIFGFGVCAALLMGSLALAQTAPADGGTGSTTGTANLTFPISALGGCTSKDACRLYCNDASHRDACYAFALSHGLMTTAEVSLAKDITSVVGPGGCQGESCKTYCQDPSNHSVCEAFAQAHHVPPPRVASTTTDFRPHSSTTPPLGSTTPHGDKPPLPPKTGSTTIDTSRLKGLCTNAADCIKLCAAKPDLCRPAGNTGDHSSTTPTFRPATATTTHPSGDYFKPPASGTTTNTGTNTGGSSPGGPDKTRPPYHCTPAQDAEGACDPDQFPGYVSPTSDMGGAVIGAFENILHFLGL